MSPWHFLLPFLALLGGVAAYDVLVTDKDYSPQICSGMWGGSNAYINVSFSPSSQGQLAMVIYEWSDNEMLGKTTSMTDDTLPKTYICTSDAVKGGICTMSELGKFIIDLPMGRTLNETSFWSARVGFRSTNGGQREETAAGSDAVGLWEAPGGNPSPPASKYDSPWKVKRGSLGTGSVVVRQMGSDGVLWHDQPIMYNVRKTGYYCVAIVPVTILSTKRQAPTDVPFHPSYHGNVMFKNTFEGKLPATDYPKVNFYFSLFLLYAVFGGVWGWQCYKYRDDLQPIQYYLSCLVGFLVIEMVANWAYYRYLNAHGRATASTVFLIVVAILDAGRNALSFFLLLVVSLGLSVVREELNSMTRCKLLAGAHFVFGVLYAVGIVELELESTSALVLLFFVIPLAFTLSGFLLWIMYALNGTIAYLDAKKQRYKLSMFKRLYHILLFAVVIIALFFVVSSFSFSQRLAEDYAANTWRVRWWLLDGWLALLYLGVFAAIAYLWRPTGNNRRLAMSDELAQEDEDAEDYDLEALERRHYGKDDDDNATLVGGGIPNAVGDDAVVFEIGDQDFSDDEDKHDKRPKRIGNDGYSGIGTDAERQGLVGKDDDD